MRKGPWVGRRIRGSGKAKGIRSHYARKGSPCWWNGIQQSSSRGMAASREVPARVVCGRQIGRVVNLPIWGRASLIRDGTYYQFDEMLPSDPG